MNMDIYTQGKGPLYACLYIGLLESLYASFFASV